MDSGLINIVSIMAILKNLKNIHKNKHIWRPWKLPNVQDLLPTLLVWLRLKFFHRLHLGRLISNKPFQMITNQLKENIIQGWLLYVIRSFLQVSVCFQYQLTDLVSLSINSFCIYLKQISSKLNWTRTMYFFVALYSCVWSCPKISRNAFFIEVFF